ncbi:MAG: hypothetical protein Q4F53_07495 [Nesterenkonia sp.]|nr:hypothetical protein [Nesterenkonia sp.]
MSLDSVLDASVRFAGLLLPESVLDTWWFDVLSVFVAINTVMYVSLALVQTLPKVHLRDYMPRRYERSQTRSIYPDASEGRQARPGDTWSRRHERPEGEETR